MTTFAVVSDTEWDDAAFATRAGGDQYNIRGTAKLIIGCDTRYCANSDATLGSIGGVGLNVTPFQGLGEIFVEGRNVRIIPYDTGAGNVPAIGTSISQGGVSGPLLGVWSALNVPPTAAGVAMPASGWIKIKAVTGGAYAAGALTGIGANATGPDIVGWLEILGREGGLCTISMRNTVRIMGEWFTHPTLTDGVNTTTYQLPASLDNTFYAGCRVETAPGSGVYEDYACAGSLVGVDTIGTDAVRGKICWISSQGLLRLGYDGANTNGYLPVAGCRIQVPNVNLINCTAGAPTVNALPNATLATRFEFATLSAGRVVIDKCNSAWVMSFVQADSLSITNTFIHESLVVTRCASEFDLDRVVIGQTAAQSQVSLQLISNRYGGTITDCFITKANTIANSFIDTLIANSGLRFTRHKTYYLAFRTLGTARCISCNSNDDCAWTDLTFGGALGVDISNSDVEFTNTHYFDVAAGRTPPGATNPNYVFNYAAGNRRVVINGLDFAGLPQVAPYTSLVSAAGSTGARNLHVRNIGAPGAPLCLGSPKRDATWTRVTTTATIADVAHGLETGDLVFCLRSSDVAAVTAVVLKAAITRLDADTFTFPCLNAGAANGTLTYYQTITGNAVLFNSANAAPRNWSMQRCYMEHARVACVPLVTNDLFELRVENVHGDAWNPFLILQQDSFIRGVRCGPTLLPQIGGAGTHWIDSYMVDGDTPNVSGVAWTSTSTTATVTSVGHNLRTGNSIVVTECSNTPRIFRGTKTLVVIDSDTFQFGINSNTGDASGTLDFEPLSGIVSALMNEPTIRSGDQAIINAGTPVWDGIGSLFANTAGDQVTWEMPDFIIGHSGFPIQIPGVGSAGGSVNEWFFHDVHYQIDKNDGAGWSEWRNLKIPRQFTGNVGSTTLSCAAGTADLYPGDYVGNQVGIAGNAKIVSIDGPNDVTVDLANVAGLGGGSSWVTHIPSETGIDAERGFKFRFRTTIIGAGTAKLPQIFVWTRSTEATRAYQYPLVSTSPVHRPIGARHVS